jgi:hypothetical protein
LLPCASATPLLRYPKTRSNESKGKRTKAKERIWQRKKAKESEWKQGVNDSVYYLYCIVLYCIVLYCIVF